MMDGVNESRPNLSCYHHLVALVKPWALIRNIRYT